MMEAFMKSQWEELVLWEKLDQSSNVSSLEMGGQPCLLVQL